MAKYKLSEEEIKKLLEQEEKIKKNYKRINNFQKQAYDRVVLTPPKGKKEEWKAYADMEGMSVNSFLINIIDNYIETTYNG